MDTKTEEMTLTDRDDDNVTYMWTQTETWPSAWTYAEPSTLPRPTLNTTSLPWLKTISTDWTTDFQAERGRERGRRRGEELVDEREDVADHMVTDTLATFMVSRDTGIVTTAFITSDWLTSLILKELISYSSKILEIYIRFIIRKFHWSLTA